MFVAWNSCTFLFLWLWSTTSSSSSSSSSFVADATNIPKTTWPPLILNKHILQRSAIAADLSSLAYANASAFLTSTTTNTTTNVTTLVFDHPDYDTIHFYTEEPDQALVARKDGRCYIAFRGTNANIEDWLQNAGLGNINIYPDNNLTSPEFCEARGGFGDFLFTDVVEEGAVDVAECVTECTDLDDCLYITGHSQGGAISTLAAITLYSLKPIVITFGQPPSIDADCPFVNQTRFYRYVNWYQNSPDDIGFDLVVYAPNWISKSVHYGYNILVGEDPTTVYYGGFGDDIVFAPGPFDKKVAAHTMAGQPYGYQERIDALLQTVLNNGTIGTQGSVGGTPCEPSHAELCISKSCNEFQCIPEGGVVELCIKASCEQDSDCAGDNVCIWDACATGDGQVQPGCPCRTSSQCANQDCVTENLLSLDFVCATEDHRSRSGGSSPKTFGGSTTMMIMMMISIMAVATMSW